MSLAALAFVGVLVPPTRAGAQHSEQQPGSGDDYDRAIDAAVDAYSAGNFDEALRAFTTAHALSPNARTQRGLGVVHFALAQYPEAIGHLQASLENTESALTGDLRDQTQGLLEAALREVGTVTLDVGPPDARVEVNGEELPFPLTPRIYLLPGVHRFRVWNDGSEQRVTLEVQAGRGHTLEIRLSPARSPSEVASPEVAPSGPETPTSEARTALAPPPPRRQRLAWALATVAYSATALAVVPYAMGRVRLRTLTDWCRAQPGGGCTPEQRAQQWEARGVDTARRAARGLAIGGTVASLGLSVWAWHRSRQRGERARSSLSPRYHLAPALSLQLRYYGLTGTASF